jgi:hypothetical protein
VAVEWLAALSVAITAIAQGVAQPAEVSTPPQSTLAPCLPEQPVDSRRRSPAIDAPEFEPTPCNPAALPPPYAGTTPVSEAMPDRWRIVSLLGYRENLLDPYHGNNWLKGDRPAFGDDWFVSLIGVSDTVLEPRQFPVPVGGPVSQRAGSLDTFGNGRQWIAAQTFALETVVYQGNTVFKPPDYEFRFTPVLGLSYVDTAERGIVKANPDFGDDRFEAALGVQALFVDKHLRNVSDRYDFDSVRVGIQPFTSDFRGFLFQDAGLGVRLFGTRANNRYQYNLAWFRRIDKDTNTGLNNIVERGVAAIRNDDVLVANLYAQDTPVLGFTSQATILVNRNREGGSITYDDNGVIQRPASLGLERGNDYDVVYLGANGDGHFRRVNVTLSAYLALGSGDRGAFVERPQRIRAAFAAAEVSRDFSWLRVRGSAAFASGDRDPFDDRATGFDAVFENPLFAGADTSFWIREPVPLIGGGRVTLSGRNGLLNSLRSSKEFGQSNFVNPGTILLGAGADADLTPTLRATVNANYLAFEDTSSLQVARAQAAIDRAIGVDASIALTWRPLAMQNIVLRLSAARLFPAAGYRQLFGNEPSYAVLANAVVTY